MMGIPGIAQAIMSAGVQDPSAPDPTEAPPSAQSVPPLIAAVMTAHANMASKGIQDRGAEELVDQENNAKPLVVKTTIDPTTGEATHDIKNIQTGGKTIDEVHAAAQRPFEDVTNALQQRQLKAVNDVVDQYARGESGDTRSFAERIADRIKTRVGIESPQEVALKSQSPAEREVSAFKAVGPVLSQVGAEHRANETTRLQRESEFERFTSPANAAKYPDAGTYLRAAQREFGDTFDADKAATAVTAFNQAKVAFNTSKMAERQKAIADVKPQDTATYQTPEDYIRDRENPENPFTDSEKSRLASRFAAAKNQWNNLTEKEQQDRIMEGQKIQVAKAQVAAAEHANKIAEATLAASQRGQQGEAALAGLPADVQNTVRGIAEGRLDIGKVTSMRNGSRENLAALVSLYDPTWSTATAPARAATLKDFTSGTASKSIQAANQAIHHLDTFSTAADALNNAPVQLWNKIANQGITQVGDARVVRLREAAHALSAELAKSYGGGEGTDTARSGWEDVFSSAQSPAQLKGAVDMAVQLLGGASSALHDKYERGMGKAANFSVLSPESKAILTKHGIDPAKIDGGVVASPAPSPGAATHRYNTTTGKIEAIKP